MNIQANCTEEPLNVEETSQLIPTDESEFKTFKGFSYLLAVINICIGIIAVLGNGLVLNAGYRNKKTVRLSYLDVVIKSLAVNDLLYGLFGIPFRTIDRLNSMWYLHESK